MLFEQILLLFGISVITVAILRRQHLPPLLGYLLTGFIVGPAALNFFGSIEHLDFIAEFGVVFLLFTIGLELSVPKLISMRRSLLTLGGMQVLICSLIPMAIAMYVGLSWPAAFTIAGALALSSTAVGTKLLIEQDEFHAPHGRLSFSILLFQDLAAVPFLILVPVLAQPGTPALGQVLLMALLKGTFVFFLILAAGRWIIRPLFHLVAAARSTELFMMTALLIVLFSAWLTESFGLSMAFGSFLAGAVMAETEYCHQIESDIRPFQDILLGLFFITIGMKIDPMILLSEWGWVLSIVAGLIIVKAGVIALLAKLSGKNVSTKSAIKTGLVLAQGGEFGFALLTLASDQQLLSVRVNQIIIASIVLSMVIAPFLIRNNRRLARFLAGTDEKDSLPAEESKTLMDATDELHNHVIICGYGRVGQALTRFLEQEGIQYVGLDLDPSRLREAKALNEPVFFGNASEMPTLEKAGIARASLLILSFNDDTLAQKSLENLRKQGYTLPILVRTRDEKHLHELQAAGATEVVPEILEASLMLASHMLMLLGYPANRVQQQILEVQKSRYQLLRGYFVGDDDACRLEEDPSIETLHAVALTEDAWAVGKNIPEIDTKGTLLNIAAFSRDGFKSASPSDETILKSGDVLVLRGKKDKLFLAEEKLLQG